MLITILGYAFLVIFILTALLTLLSLPGWVTIPEQYRKVLFRSLILEVVGAIVILFTNSYIKDHPGNLTIIQKPNPANWVGLDLNGTIIQPTLKLKNPDTSLTLGSDITQALARLKNIEYLGEIGSKGIVLKNENDQAVGSVPKTELTKNGLFNTIDSEQEEIAGAANYSLIKFIKNNEGKWIRSGSFLSPFSIRVFDLESKTIYEINNTQNQEILFSSSQSSEPLFNTDNRKLHFYHKGSNFFLIRITEADLSGDKKFVHFLQIKFRPALELN